MWRSTQNGFEAPLPADGYRTTMTPNVDVKGLGYFGESSINEKNSFIIYHILPDTLKVYTLIFPNATTIN